jgi:DNA-binding MarR family transcriptional regulator
MPHPATGQSSSDATASLIQAAAELIPLLDRTVLRLRFSQGLPGTSPLEARILDYVCFHGPVRIGEIGAAAGLSFPNASRYVKNLTAKGLLEASRDPEDGRAQRVGTTARGRELLDRAEAAIRAEADRMLSPIPAAEREALERGFRGLSALLAPLAEAIESNDRNGGEA